MSFVQFKLERISDQTRGSFDIYVYSPENGDTIADVTTPGYFNEARFAANTDWTKAYIIANCSDGYTTLNPEFGLIGQGERAISSISLDTSLPEPSRTISLAGTVDPTISVNPSHISFVNTPIDFSGSLATANPDGTITINQDISYLSLSCMAITRFASKANIELGVGIGDPSVLPTKPGTSTDVLPLGTYISRFRDSSRGEGANREVSLNMPYFPVSKTITIGAKSGDKIFIVAWTQESTATSVVFDDCIFVIEAFIDYQR